MKTFIDPFDLTPKYGQLSNIIRQKIENGEWGCDKPIPSERELEELFAVSRTTVRQALAVLVNRGFIYRDHGRGTFVIPKKLQDSLHNLTSFTDDMLKRGLQPGHKILAMEFVEPTLKVRNELTLPDETSQVLFLERLRLANGEPIGLHSSYLPLSPAQSFTLEELEQAGSLYNLLVEKYNWIPTEADETIEATVSDEREAELLDIGVNQPLLLVRRTLYNQFRKVMEYVKVLYRADRYQYVIHLTR